MSREDLELENLIEIQNTEYYDSSFYSGESGLKDSQDYFKRVASAIMTWHKQREVELLRELIEHKEYASPDDCNFEFYVEAKFIQKLIDERMVGK